MLLFIKSQDGDKVIFQATFLHLNIVTGERKRGCTMAEILVRRQCLADKQNTALMAKQKTLNAEQKNMAKQI